ncbi:MAG: sister chromatid cohesion protein PDS5 [Bacteroidales bacterium]|nr:sister chromatid cohesion protein PDS5 [Bacteroidales bacterium]
MASIRRLKKNLNYLTGELINECLIYQYFNKDANPDKVAQVLSRILENHNDLIYRIHHCNVKGDKKKVKAYYRSIIDDFNKGVELLDQLGK